MSPPAEITGLREGIQLFYRCCTANRARFLTVTAVVVLYVLPLERPNACLVCEGPHPTASSHSRDFRVFFGERPVLTGSLCFFRTTVIGGIDVFFHEQPVLTGLLCVCVCFCERPVLTGLLCLSVNDLRLRDFFFIGLPSLAGLFCWFL